MSGALVMCIVMTILAVSVIFINMFVPLGTGSLVSIIMAGIFGGLTGHYYDKYRKWKSKL